MADARTELHRLAPWLFAPELGTCIVGSMALAEACRRAGLRGPTAADLDLSWGLSLDRGEALLRAHGVFKETTAANRARGTLAMQLPHQRVEVTAFRGDTAGQPLAQRLDADLRARDMTVGALAWSLADDRIADPTGGLEDWRQQRVVAVGDPAERVGEHPVRWLRYYRRTHQWGFSLDPRVRKLRPDQRLIAQIPAEAVAAEFRAALLDGLSPGRFFMELYEAGLLPHLAPELSPQFDGRPAGPVRHHPEVSQALHLILCLEWLRQRVDELSPDDRCVAAVAVLCHDLGKGTTPAKAFPAHHGHEGAGLPLIDALLDRLPGLVDGHGRRLAKAVSELHLLIRNFDKLRPATRADLYDRHFRRQDFQVHLFALAVGADVGGRLGRTTAGDRTVERVERDIAWLCAQCRQVDARALRQRFADDARFRSALHQAWSDVVRHPPRE